MLVGFHFTLTFGLKHQNCTGLFTNNPFSNLAHSHFDFYSSPALSVLFLPIIERGVLMALVVYYKDMLEKVTMQRIQQPFFVTEKTQSNTALARLLEKLRPN